MGIVLMYKKDWHRVDLQSTERGQETVPRTVLTLTVTRNHSLGVAMSTSVERTSQMQ